MSKSWEWRVFFPAAQVPAPTGKYLKAFWALKTPNFEGPKNYTYVVAQRELVQGGDGIGVKHRGVFRNMELKVRLSKVWQKIKG